MMMSVVEGWTVSCIVESKFAEELIPNNEFSNWTFDFIYAWFTCSLHKYVAIALVPSADNVRRRKMQEANTRCIRSINE